MSVQVFSGSRFVFGEITKGQYGSTVRYSSGVVVHLLMILFVSHPLSKPQVELKSYAHFTADDLSGALMRDGAPLVN